MKLSSGSHSVGETPSGRLNSSLRFTAFCPRFCIYRNKGNSIPFHLMIFGEAKRRVNEKPNPSKKMRSAGILISVLAAAILLGAGPAQARKKKAAPPPGLPDHISALGKKLYGLDVDDAKPVTDEIQKLVVAHMNTWMAGRSPSIIEVRHELDQVFSKLEYPAVGISSAFRAPWKNAELIGVGYTLGWSNIWRVNVLTLYENQNGHSQEVATTDFVPRTDMHYAVLPPSANGDFRFLTYGWRLGMSHPRLSAILYSFDGKNLQSPWKTENLFDGKLTVTNDTLVIRYVNEDEYIRQTQQGHMPPRYEQTYKVTPQGLQLVSEHEIPYQ